MAKSTDVQQFIEDQNGGVLIQQMGHLLSEVATGVTNTGKDGEVTIKFKIKRNGDEGSTQVNIKAELAHKTPTSRGQRTETTSSETPMHVGSGGAITLFPAHAKQLIDERR